jgi:hypothetical protein
MSDALRSSTGNVEQLVADILAARPGRIRARRSSYAGLRHRTTSSTKYRDCVYVGPPTNRVRELSTGEIEELQAHVQRCKAARS